MKKFLIWATGIFAAVLLLVFGMMFFTFNKIDTNTVTDEELRTSVSEDQIQSDAMSAFSQLTEDEQKAYIRVVKELENKSDVFYLEGNTVTNDQLERIWKAVTQDHPEFFWIDTYEYTYRPDTGEVDKITIRYNMDTDDIESAQARVDAWKTAALSGITDDMSSYEVARYLHDYIIDNTGYDTNAPNNQTILSVADGASVCAGYARAYQYLLNEAGIFATTAQGTTVLNQSHAWNLVKIDDEYGWIDPTWDDPNYTDGTFGTHDYTYFGISTTDLNKTHTLDTSLTTYPDFAEPSWNYYVKEGLDFDLDQSGAFAKITQAIEDKAAAGEKTLTLRVASSDLVDSLLNQLSYDSVSSSYNLTYVRNDYYPVILFMF